jgi:pyruvate-ferredoxin/flavodoxin oxidoreductase
VAYGAKDTQTLRVFLEAESYAGPSLIVAYSPCIAHGVDLQFNLRQQELAVKSGHWPLFRYDPRLGETGANPWKLDSPAPSLPIQDFMQSETRFAMLSRSHPEDAARFLAAAQKAADERFAAYKALSAAASPTPGGGAGNEPKIGD